MTPQDLLWVHFLAGLIVGVLLGIALPRIVDAWTAVIRRDTGGQ